MTVSLQVMPWPFRQETLRRVLLAALHFPGKAAAASRTADRETARLLDAYGASILRFTYSYVHNMSDAEELLQDTLMQYLRKAPRFDSPAHEKAWLLRVAANLSKNRIAYNRLREADPLEETFPADQREDLSFVWEAVKALPAPYREVVHLYYYENYATAEIAVILKRKEATVRSDLRRGRAQLKEILKEVYDFD